MMAPQSAAGASSCTDECRRRSTMESKLTGVDVVRSIIDELPAPMETA
jgi:hypothetical protein